MKNLIRFSLPFLLFSLLFAPKLCAKQDTLDIDLDQEISMDFQDANIMDVLKIFSMQSGLNFVASESVRNRKMTLYLDKVPIKQAMDQIFKANNMSYELMKDANIFIVKDNGKPELEMVTKVFFLKYHSVPSAEILNQASDELGTDDSSSSDSGNSTGTEGGILGAVTQVLSSNGKVAEDIKTNSLIITDVASRFDSVQEVLSKLDVPRPQVMLEVEMLDVSKNAVDAMGFNWTGASSYAMSIVSASRTTGFPLGQFGKDSSGSAITAGNVTFPTTLTAVMNFLKTDSNTRYLARPRILTMNNEPAEIKITTQETVGTKQSQTSGDSPITTEEAERVETGVSLKVTPQINMETGEVTMFIVPSVKEATTSTVSSSGRSFKDPEERSTKSLVRVRDNDTVIIGGLIRKDKTETVSKIPFLGDIPLLGGLFRNKNMEKDKDRELIVFITPRIIKEPAADLNRIRNTITNVPQREQGMSFVSARENMVDESLNNYKKYR